ncbi:Zn-finger nucleic acid-binding protein [Streptomyces sp. SPB4]|nr:Zn-finger nucleic acid-binding protein [Streptomyces sp. SPB4]
MTEKTACPHCGQDWIAEFKMKSDGKIFYMCPECESIWLDKSLVHQETEYYLSEFLESRYPPDRRAFSPT